MKQYLDGLKYILENGVDVSDRTGVGTRQVFGYQMRFDLNEGFPAVTTKKLAWKAMVGELLWFLEGSVDERRLAELTYGKHRTELADKTTIWTANADNQGKALGYRNDEKVKFLGPVYGRQWRNFGDDFPADQIKNVIEDIKKTPDSRRLIISAWNPSDIPYMALPPCHVMAQFRVVNGKLSCMMTQRSADAFLGVPFNIASYALLTHIIARETNLDVGEFIISIGDFHIYNNHMDQVMEQLQRTPHSLPKLYIDEKFELLPYGKEYDLDTAKLITLLDYQSYDTIKAPMAV